MSVKLTTNLSQRLVLTPQLRQRIEMLQMTSVELTDLIQQQLLENPILEEVQNQDEKRELEKEILDQLSGSHDGEATGTFEASAPESLNGDTPAAQANGAGDSSTLDVASSSEGPDSYEGETAPSAESFEEEFEPTEQTTDAFEEIDFGREFQDYLDPGYKTQEFEYKEDAPTFEQFLTRAPSLSEHLMWQLHMSHADERLLAVAECVIGNLDSDGRLNATNDEIAAPGNWAEEEVERARQAVMRLDPVGCGARDARECLLVQLDVRGEGECPHGEGKCLASVLVRDHSLADLQQHKLPNLAKLLNVSVESLVTELSHIRKLDPYPGRRYSSEEPILIAPEVFIEKVEGHYEIYFADDGGPRLRISQSYQQMLGRPDTSKETRDFIKDKVRSAVDLLRNIEHRRQTIFRVVECIVQRQHEFLDKGVQYIKPMMLKDVAEDTGMHLSTVSRVVNRKYAHTPQGVIELRRFFTEGMTNEDGEEVSTRIIKLQIKKLIEEEDSHNPITDDQVVKILAKDGIKLSRRTVAKYRDQMQIPGSRERRAVV
ncbi:MAG TPA: RNA polymerase factor sigma-54 [Pyrinomonadaceae bacterium]|jgi:RNA polymerase sigma-54 factor|nr:RNA polymerase factor sigma-54 [Pyrinomonadaceae bacterium]